MSSGISPEVYKFLSEIPFGISRAIPPVIFQELLPIFHVGVLSEIPPGVLS